MKQVEMWKWFKLPVSCELIPHGCLSKNDLVSFSESKFMTDHHLEKVEIAINSYDANQALIAKQAEQIKILRSILIDTLAVVQGGMSQTIANGVKALEATKDSV